MFLHTLAHYVPEQRVPNAYFEGVNGLSDDWIVSRTGIRERRKAGPEENTHTMAWEAVQRAIARRADDGQSIDLIIAATYTPYDTVSTLAHYVQHRLELPDVPAVTITAACSSLINAVEIVQGYFAMGKARHALVVVSEHNTAFSNDHDPVAGHLWGDGATALLIHRERQTEADLEIRDLFTGGAATVGRSIEGVNLFPRHGGISMRNGKDVFTWACTFMEQTANRILERNQLTMKQIAYFVPHQANLRISKQVMQRLDLPEDRLLSNIQYLGNTGSAGCGIALSENRHRLQAGEYVIVTVFGGGYSYGAMLLRA
ncbi:MAG: ketoacyl-ACP synthase III [Bacteroidia bacterium]|nr:ketoacyl-ACP synthase III [Bacteroidia bacterium]